MKKVIKRFYEVAVENSSDGIYFVDQRRKILYWNKVAEEITGFVEKEIVGNHCHKNILRHMDEDGNLLCLSKCPLVESIRSGVPLSKSVYLHDKVGSRIPVNVEVYPVRNRKGKIIGAVERFNISLGLSLTKENIIRLQKEAYIDSLTQIPNRRYFEKRFLEVLNEIKSGYRSASLLISDVDNFKNFNDTFGHLAGDAVLKAVAQTLLWNIKPVDLVARFGGDEFVLIMQDVDLESLSKIARKLQMLVSKSEVRYEGNFLNISISFGGTIIYPDDNLDRALKRADKNLYKAKKLPERFFIA